MTDKEKLIKIKKLADAMYYAAQYLTTDASGLHKAMEEYHQFIINEYHKEEPVSEDLEEAAIMHFKDVMEYEVKTGLKMANITSFKAGAKWQKLKDSTVSEELEKTSKEYADKNYAEWLDFVSGDERDDHYPITEAFKAGARWYKEQMMSKAVERKVLVSPCGIPCIDATELYDYDDDKVKVIIIKDK